MKILFTELNEAWQEEFVRNNLPNEEIFIIPNNLTVQNFETHFRDIEITSIFIGTQMNSVLINLLPNLKYITTRSTGFEHIDISAAKQKNINISNVPFYGENTVAEHAMALILSLSRNLRASFERIKDGKFNYDGLRGWDLKGKRLGIVGGGHIGMHVARMAKGFEMDVVVFDLHPDPNLSNNLGFNYVSIEDLLKTSDVISLHLPLNEHTFHFFDQPQFDLMKKGVYIINTARGGLINTSVLLKELKSGHVAGAGLDVLEEENFLQEEDLQIINDLGQQNQLMTLLEDHMLMEMENVIVTPHNAFNSKEALERIMQTTVENIKNYLNGIPISFVS